MGRVLLAAMPAGESDARPERVLAAAPVPAFTLGTITTLDGLRAAVADAREDGHAVVDEELERGLRSIAVPVRAGAGAGETVAAMNVATHAARRPVDDLREVVLPHLLRAADAIRADLGRLRTTT